MKYQGKITQILNMNDLGVSQQYYVEIVTQFNETKYIAIDKRDIKCLYPYMEIIVSDFLEQKAVIQSNNSFDSFKIIGFKLEFLNSDDFSSFKRKVV